MRRKIKERTSEGTGNMNHNKNMKKLFVPTILLSTLVIVTLLISTILINNEKIYISKIFSNSIMADTVTTQDIGTDVVANFDRDTGELSISTSSLDIFYEINKDSFRSFINTRK